MDEAIPDPTKILLILDIIQQANLTNLAQEEYTLYKLIKKIEEMNIRFNYIENYEYYKGNNSLNLRLEKDLNHLKRDNQIEFVKGNTYRLTDDGLKLARYYKNIYKDMYKSLEEAIIS